MKTRTVLLAVASALTLPALASNPGQPIDAGDWVILDSSLQVQSWGARTYCGGNNVSRQSPPICHLGLFLHWDNQQQVPDAVGSTVDAAGDHWVLVEEESDCPVSLITKLFRCDSSAVCNEVAYIPRWRCADGSEFRPFGLWVDNVAGHLYIAGGVGAGHESMTSDRALVAKEDPLIPSPGKLDGSGGAASPATEIAAGFGVYHGLVLGLSVETVTIPKVSVASSNSLTGTYRFGVSQLALIGPLVDFYPGEEGGFHLQGSVDLATYVAGVGTPEVAGPTAQGHTALGFGVTAGIGYEWWVGEEWSLGALARFAWGSTSGTDNRGVSWDHRSYAPALLVGATYQ